MKVKVKDKLVGVYAPGNYDHTSVLGQTQEFSKWFWANHEDAEYISAKLGIDTKKLNRILTLEQLPDEELLRKMMELCKQRNTHYIKVRNYWRWELSVKSLNNWVCQLTQSVTMAHQCTLEEHRTMEGD